MYFVFNHTIDINTIIKFLQIVSPVFAYKLMQALEQKKI